ncbi:MAG: iron ABC transporter permease [SAR202 cluster bacterium Io17-Chloro-G9]|nr:MAG: iron ABC transporter permease [SAR202 cluster bacterium Io17-Chloro-G9]
MIDRLGRPPPIIWIPATVVAAALVLPPAYLMLRATGAGGEAWEVLFRVRILEILVRTFLLIGAVTGASILLAVPLAWLTVRTDLPMRRVWSVATALPLVIPSYVGGLIVVVALGPRGMLQQFLDNLWGVERLPDIYGFPGALLTLTFLSYPYVLLTVRAALMRMDPALEEASRGLGRSSRATFFRVILPLLRPSIAGGSLLVALYTLSDFGAVSLLRYETFTWAIFLQYDSALDRTLAATMSLALVAIALGIVAAETLTRGRARYFRSDPGATGPGGRVRLGRWTWPALAFCAAVTIISLALPLSILGYWVVRGLAAGEQLPSLWILTRNSLFVSALAAGVAVIAALPIASLSVRYPSFFSTLLERTAYIGFALPGIAIALALVFFGANYAPPLYQTMALLILAYVLLFLSPAVGATRTSLLQVNPRIEDAARGLGRTPQRVLASVTVPLVRPGIMAGAALVFLLTMKELPATLILSPIGFNTLATSIWSAASEAYFARAAAPALLLIGVSSIPLAFLMLRERR